MSYPGQVLGPGRWQVTRAGDGQRFTLDGVLRAVNLGAELGLTPYVLTSDGGAVVLDPRAAIRDRAGRLVWDGRPLDPTTPRRRGCASRSERRSRAPAA